MKKHFKKGILAVVVAFICSTAPTIRAQELVTWTNLTNVSVSGQTISKIAGGNSWNAGGSSTQILPEGVDGWVEAKANDIDKLRVIGLSAIDLSVESHTINFSIYLKSDGTFVIQEFGVNLTTSLSYSIGDVFRIERNGNTIEYLQNGSIVHTSIIGIELPLIVDVALYTADAKLEEVLISTSFLANYTPPTSRLVSWTNTLNIDESIPELIIKNGGTNGWNTSGASSEEVLPAGVDGWIETVALERNTARMVGMSVSDIDHNYVTINYAIYLLNTGNFQIYENGTSVFNGEAYYTGDIFRVERTGNQILYKRNGTIVHTTGIGPESTLLVDASLSTYGTYDASLYRTRISESFTTDYTPPTSRLVSWTNTLNIDESIPELIIKNGGTNGWNTSGASSEEVLPAGVDGWIETVALERNTARMVGMSVSDIDHNYVTINFAIYLLNTGNFQIYENGTSVFNGEAYYTGDIFRVERTGNQILYKRNGTIVHTTGIGPESTLLVDASLSTYGTYDASLYRTRISESFTTDYTPPTSRLVSWTNTLNIDESIPELIIKNGGTNGWNTSGASSEEVLPAGVDGWIETVALERNTSRMVGMSILDIDQDYATINFAIFLRSNGYFHIYENGTSVFDGEAYYSGDIFRVERTGNQILYKYNGAIVHTTDTGQASNLLVDVSLATYGVIDASLYRTRISPSFELSSNFYAITDGYWSDPSVWSDSFEGVPLDRIPGRTDTVYVQGHNIIIDSEAACSLLLIRNNDSQASVTVVNNQLTVFGEIRIEKEPGKNETVTFNVEDGGSVTVLEDE